MGFLVFGALTTISGTARRVVLGGGVVAAGGEAFGGEVVAAGGEAFAGGAGFVASCARLFPDAARVMATTNNALVVENKTRRRERPIERNIATPQFRLGINPSLPAPPITRHLWQKNPQAKRYSSEKNYFKSII